MTCCRDRYDFRAAHLEKEYCRVDHIETVLERHAFEASHWVYETVQNAEQRVCSVNGFVDEACVWFPSDIGEQWAARLLLFFLGIASGCTIQVGLESKGIDIEPQELERQDK
jgi:hypothetical protein